MKNLFLFLTVMACTFQSCSSDDAISDEPKNADDSQFAGTWSGTYEGDDSGTFIIVISVNSIVTAASSFSNYANQTFQGATGYIIPPSGSYIVNNPNGSVSTVQITGDTITGTWVNPSEGNISGTLSGSRE